MQSPSLRGSPVLYRSAGTMALLIVSAGLVDALTSNLGAGAQVNNVVQVSDWFGLFQTHPFSAFSRLGIINILTVSLGIPIYLAFTVAYRRVQPRPAAFAALLFFLGAAVYLSSNTLFPLFALSRQYAAAAAAQRPILEAAAAALLAQGADLTSGTYGGLLLTQLAGLLIAATMLRGGVFSRLTGLAGLAGFGLMILFFSLAAFVPQFFAAALWIAMPGGLILMGYQILLARRFFQLANQER